MENLFNISTNVSLLQAKSICSKLLQSVTDWTKQYIASERNTMNEYYTFEFEFLLCIHWTYECAFEKWDTNKEQDKFGMAIC